MSGHSLREVVQLAGLSRHIVLRLVKEGVVRPERAGREYRFSFQDLIVLRTARSLYAANVPPRRIARSLRRLRDVLPAEVPMCGLRVSASGADIVVHESNARWAVDSGQLLLDFEVKPDGGATRIVERAAAQPSAAEQHFELACRLEDEDPERACAQYRRALACDPAYLSAYMNLGTLLHSLERLEEAQSVYQAGIARCRDNALLWFNLGVLSEDLGHAAEALAAYRSALETDPELADAYYNSARLHAMAGHAQEALRAFNDYRRLKGEAPN